MSFVLDHFFICCDVGAPEAKQLVKFGLVEGTPNRHVGQGTANRRFFFQNAMLELLWVEDSVAAQNQIARPTKLWERWSARSDRFCPFGLAFRPTGLPTDVAPFPAWEYKPPYLPDPFVIHIGADCSLYEPLWFYLDFARPPDAERSEVRQPIEHPIGICQLTGMQLTLPDANNLSVVAQCVSDAGLITLETGRDYLLEATFDNHAKGCTADFRPTLPLRFCW